MFCLCVGSASAAGFLAKSRKAPQDTNFFRYDMFPSDRAFPRSETLILYPTPGNAILVGIGIVFYTGGGVYGFGVYGFVALLARSI